MENKSISIVTCYRNETEEDKNAIYRFFDSLKIAFGNLPIEVLIKLDSDNISGIKIIKDLKQKYDFIKYFIFNRWEGRWTLNYIWSYLVLEKDINTKFFTLACDDMIYTRNIEKEIQTYFNNDYCIFGQFSGDISNQSLSRFKDYTSTEWIGGAYVSYNAFISTKIIEIMGGFGFSAMVDSTFGLLNLIMFKKYGINLAKKIDNFSMRQDVLRDSSYGKTFNQKTLITCGRTCTDPYFYILMEQQAKNIYLNMKEEERC